MGREGRVSLGQPRLSQERGVPALPNFGDLLYLCLHPLKQNDQIRHGNTYGRACFKRWATPLHLHKCVARFVTDSWVSRLYKSELGGCKSAPTCIITPLGKGNSLHRRRLVGDAGRKVALTYPLICAI